MNKLNKWIVLGAMALVIWSSCEKEDEPIAGDKPVASFTTLIEDLQVTFTNTSSGADSYAWDFGDGNTSDEVSPTHQYSTGGSYEVTLTATNAFGSTTSKQTLAIVEPDKYKKEGYYIFTLAESSGGATYYGGYFEDIPSGSVDMTQFSTYSNARIRAQYNEFLYGLPLNLETGLVKYAIDAETNQIVKVDEIPTLSQPMTVVIVNSELGFYSTDGNIDLNMFNPTTMEELGQVDMSASKIVEGNDLNHNTTLLYNKKLGKIYSVLYTDNSATGTFYDANSVYIEVVDVASKTHEKSIVHSNAQYPVNRGNFAETIIDEEGNTYLIAQGSYGLDGQLGPTAPPASRPQILKINTNSEFEESYAFNPVNELGFENNFFQLFVTMIYAGDNKAYGIATGGPESNELLALLAKLGAGTITQAEYAQLTYLVLYTESMRVVEVDLHAKSVQMVDNIPLTAGFAYPYMYRFEQTIYTQLFANGGSFNGFYAIDLNSGAVSEQFNITAGGLTQQFIDISAGFRE